MENGQEAAYDQVLAEFLTEFCRSQVGLCYDSGHENVQGACFRLLERFGSRLVSLHIHDNRGTDTHTLPYEGSIDWDRFRGVLSRLQYRGNLLLEADIRNSQFKDPVVFLSQAMDRALRLVA